MALLLHLTLLCCGAPSQIIRLALFGKKVTLLAFDSMYGCVRQALWHRKYLELQFLLVEFGVILQ